MSICQLCTEKLDCHVGGVDPLLNCSSWVINRAGGTKLFEKNMKKEKPTPKPTETKIFEQNFLQATVAGLGGARDAPPRGPNSFNFMQFLAKLGKIICFPPPRGVGAPSLGEILETPLVKAYFVLHCLFKI